MGDNYDFNSKKYLWLLIIVCAIFAIFIIKAFDYLPDRSGINQNAEENYTESSPTGANYQVNTKVSDEKNDTPLEKSDIEQQKNDKQGTIIVKDSDKPDIIEEIDTPPQVISEESPKIQESVTEVKNLTPEEEALKAILTAKKYAKSKDYTTALTEYQKVATLTNDSELIAMSYEGIAELYALSKRYGTALSFAAKAYNVSPSTSREMLIARIYYRSGNTENAVTRLNNLLKREFTN